jgi:hypothetical protein
MTTKTRNWLITLFILAAPFLLFLSFLLFWDAEPLPPLAPLPNPNGYEDLVKAGEMVSTNSWNYDSANLEQLRETIAANTGALALARAGLSNECRVPVQFSQGYLKQHTSDLVSVRQLAQAFVAEGKLAEMENHPTNAAKSFLDAIHSGIESASGGVLIDQMVGIAMEAIGTSHLQNLFDQLDAKSCRETAAILETLDAQRQTWQVVMQQENAWSRRTFPGMRNDLGRLILHNSMNKNFQRAEEKFNQQRMKTRQLIIALATHAYKLEKGHPPTSVADLVPDYLKAIPQDPSTGTNLVYSP